MRIAVPAMDPMLIDHDMNGPSGCAGGIIADGGKMGVREGGC
jgi:hypothetical protein